MKKVTYKICLVFFSLIIASLLHGESTIEVRTGAFFPTSKRFRKVYRDVSQFVELEASFSCNPCYAFWANFDWVTNHGRSFGRTCRSEINHCNRCSKHPSTKAHIANFSFGIKFPFEICPTLISYLGIGPSFGAIWIHNHTHHHHKHKTSKGIAGVVLKSGINHYFTPCTYLGVFLDYLYQPVHFKHNKHNHIDIGGVKTGASLGFAF